MSDKLKPCPFCGSETSPYAVRFQDSEESDLLKSAIDWLRKESVMLGNLLAVIHRDRGQYVRGVGVAQACIDAEVIVAGMNEQIEAVDELMQQAALAEREECADLCEDAFNKWDSKETDTWNCGVLYYSGLIRASSRR